MEHGNGIPVQGFNLEPGVEVGVPSSGPNVDAAGSSTQVCNERKRRDRTRTPTTTREEKRNKHNEACRNSRKKHKALSDRLKAIVSRYGGPDVKMEDKINQIEDELPKFEHMKNKFGGMEEIVSKLHIMEQIASMFQGNVYGMVPEIIRLKNIELKYIKVGQIHHLNQSAQPLQVEDYTLSEMFLGADLGTTPEGPDDARVTELLDGNILSGSCLFG